MTSLSEAAWSSTGQDWAPYRADVGIVRDRIAMIGRISSRGVTEIDAEGHAVTPGFIDIHTHFDAQVFWDHRGTNSCWHGVTTVLMGNCGFTLAPAAADQKMLVVHNLERAEDMSARALAAGIDWSWTTYPEFLDAVDALPKGLNYAGYVGHSALRTHVMGERAFEQEATQDDLEQMERCLFQALEAGAAGFSTSRTVHHQTSDDRPVASRLASWSEVDRLVRLMGGVGTGVFQYAEDPLSDPERMQARRTELLALSAQTGVPFMMGAMRGQESIDTLDLSISAGARVHGVTHPRGIGTMSSFRTQLPFDRLPVWGELRALPLDEQLRQLHDPDVVARLVRAAHEGPYGEAFGGEARPPEFDRMRVLDSPLPPNPTVAEAATARGLDPVELMICLAVETDLHQFFIQTLVPFDDEMTARLLRHPLVVAGFSDSGAHVSQMSDASIYTHLLGHWVRKRQEFSLADAIRMVTLAPARAIGLHDRGMIREGLVADINVIDAELVAPAMPRVVEDLPAGEKRIEQKATGIIATLVRGVPTVLYGEHTGSFPGQVIRPRRSAR